MATFFLLLVTAAVIAIYLLRPPPLPVVVPSNLVWRRLIEQRRPWRERLRWLLSLLLCLAIASAVAVALLRAPWWSRIGDAGALVLVIDNAPSMATRHPDGTTRLERAVAAARSALDELDTDRAVTVCDTSGRLRGSVAGGRWLDPDTARQRLEAITVSPSARRRPLAVPPLPRDSEARILFFTDGVAPPLEAGQLRGLVSSAMSGEDSEAERALRVAESVETVSVFAPAHNVGVTALELARPPGQTGRTQLWIQVSHSAPTAERVRLELHDLNGLRLAQTLELEAAQLFSATVDATGWAVGPIEARVAPVGARDEVREDDLPADDRAWTWNTGGGQLAVTLVSPRTLAATPLSVLLEARAGVTLRIVAPEAALPEGTDLVIWDRSAPTQRPDRPSLFVAPPPREWLPLTDEWVTPPIAGWSLPPNGDRPTDQHGLAGVALERLSAERLRGTRQAARPSGSAESLTADLPVEGWQPLVVQSTSPVVLAADGGAAQEPAVVTAFEIDEESPAPPETVVLLHALIDRLTGRSPVSGRTAGLVVANAPSLLGAHDPRGELTEGIALGDNYLYDLPPGLWLDPRAGVAAGRRAEAIVLRPDPTLVDVNRSTLATSADTVEAESAGLVAPGIRVLLFIALVLALLESWTFHRRLTV